METEFFKKRSKAGFEEKLQFVLILIISVAVYFELLGMNYIVDGFLVGLVLSEGIENDHVEKNLLQNHF